MPSATNRPVPVQRPMLVKHKHFVQLRRAVRPHDVSRLFDRDVTAEGPRRTGAQLS